VAACGAQNLALRTFVTGRRRRLAAACCCRLPRRSLTGIEEGNARAGGHGGARMEKDRPRPETTSSARGEEARSCAR
jgi:hypothetical protein